MLQNKKYCIKLANQQVYCVLLVCARTRNNTYIKEKSTVWPTYSYASSTSSVGVVTSGVGSSTI